MRKILFDYQIFSTQRVGGISRYFVELMSNFPDEISGEFFCCLTDNIYLHDNNNSFRRYSFVDFKGKIRLYKFINKMLMKSRFKEKDYDIFHPTYYNPYFIRHIHSPYVITVHDMIHEKFNDLFPDASIVIAQKKQSILNADMVIAISENTKKDLMDIYGMKENKIRVVNHGININETTSSIANLPRKFILFVGERSGYKNFKNFLLAFAQISKQNKELHLICTGNKFSSTEMKLQSKLGVADKVHHYFVSDRQLRYLYQEAVCFVYPSLYEGFGLPILEAFMMGCPVVLSDGSCFPEIAQSAAVYFDAEDTDSIKEAVNRVIEDSVLRNQLIDNGKEKLHDYTINNMVSKTIDVYSEFF